MINYSRNPVNLKDRAFFNGDLPDINPYLLPQKLSKTKYELISSIGDRFMLVTTKRNREEVIKLLAQRAKALFYDRKCFNTYSIYITENGKMELYISTKNKEHKQFINFLCQQHESSL